MIFDEGAGILAARYKESAEEQQVLNFDPDIPQYLLLESAGVLAVVTARASGKLIGYNVMVLTPNLHHAGVKYAINDGLFVDKAWRGQEIFM